MILCLAVLAAAVIVAVPGLAAPKGLDKQGKPDLKFAGPLAFGPEGVLFVGDPMSAAIYAIDTAETTAASARGNVKIDKVDEKIASLLGTTADQVLVNDLACNPKTGTLYLSVSRGKGPSAAAVIVRINTAGKLSEFSLEKVNYASAALPNAPGPDAKDRRGALQRMESITDLAYVDGRVFVAGLSNEEFASKLRSIPFPFSAADNGTSVEIYHGSHGAFETRSPVRTFVPFDIGGEPNLLAAYTCTPLVKFPVSQLSAGQKLRGTTVAELGNGNRPLDMIVYKKEGKTYLLLANDKRGVMKIPTDNLGSAQPITTRQGDKAGIEYETIADLKGVMQLDLYDTTRAVLLVRGESGLGIQTMNLP
ncbi:MAG: hypothetical protein HYS13_09605 [Planctomycetia bacterium]|nr:hypothetical protein [Planctomycetia bacterium]